MSTYADRHQSEHSTDRPNNEFTATQAQSRPAPTQMPVLRHDLLQSRQPAHHTVVGAGRLRAWVAAVLTAGQNYPTARLRPTQRLYLTEHPLGCFWEEGRVQ